MSSEDYSTDPRDDTYDHPAKGTDLEADLFRVGQLVATTTLQASDHDDQFNHTVSEALDEFTAWANTQQLSRSEAIATAWFFLLRLSDQ